MTSIPFGTIVTATLDQPGSINVSSAINYLRQYIEYIEVPVTINGQPFPRKKIEFNKKITGKEVRVPQLSYKMDIGYGSQFPLSVDILVSDIQTMGTPLKGYIYI